jgi:hypothetical protein
MLNVTYTNDARTGVWNGTQYEVLWRTVAKTPGVCAATGEPYAKGDFVFKSRTHHGLMAPSRRVSLNALRARAGLPPLAPDTGYPMMHP